MIYQNMKQCNFCKKLKPATLEFFHKHTAMKDGLRGNCKVCALIKRKQYRKKNPEKIKSYSKQYYHENKEKEKARSKQYYHENKDKAKKQMQQWRKNNPEKRKELYKDWYDRNKEYHKEWRKKNYEKVLKSGEKYRSENKDKIAVIKQNRRARKKSLPNTISVHDIKVMHEYFDNKCAVCGRPKDMFNTLELDHWIPLSNDSCPGTTKYNIVPLCGNRLGLDTDIGCNPSKGNKDALKWLIERFGDKEAKVIYARIMDYFTFVKQLQERS